MTAEIELFVRLPGELVALANTGYASLIALSQEGDTLLMRRTEGDGVAPVTLGSGVPFMKSLEIPEEGLPAFAELIFLPRRVAGDVQLDAIAHVDGRVTKSWRLGVTHLSHLVASFTDSGPAVFFYAVDRKLYRLEETGRPTLIQELLYPVAGMAWIGDRLVVAQGSEDGLGRLSRFDRSGRPAGAQGGFADRLVTNGSDPSAGVLLWGLMPAQPPGGGRAASTDVTAYAADLNAGAPINNLNARAQINIGEARSRGSFRAAGSTLWGGDAESNQLVRVTLS